MLMKCNWEFLIKMSMGMLGQCVGLCVWIDKKLQKNTHIYPKWQDPLPFSLILVQIDSQLGSVGEVFGPVRLQSWSIAMAITTQVTQGYAKASSSKL